MRSERVLSSLVAALAGLVAAWPITTLVDGGEWVRGAVFMVLLGVGAGIVGRALGLPEAAVFWLEVLVVLAALWLVFLAGSPDGSLEGLRSLVTEADQTIRKYSAPAPETTGLRFVIVALVALLTVLTDAISVGLRSPAVAGLPLMSIYLISAANTTAGLNPMYFVAAAGCWLLMLALQTRSDVNRWSNTTAMSTAPAALSDRLGLGGFASMARIAAVVALVGALLLPHALPSSAPRFLGNGLGHRDGSVGTVGLSSTLDISRSLVSNDRTPVLTYSTTDPNPQPLRVMTSSTYADGQWSADLGAFTEPGRNDSPMQLPDGLSRRTPFTEQKLQVTSSTLLPGQLAAPTPTLGLSLPDVGWDYDPQTSVIRPARTATHYAVTYAKLGAGARPSSLELPSGFERNLALDPNALPQLRATDRAISSSSSPFDRALAIQTYLRSGGGFAYSLTLPAPGTDANGQPLDPLTSFLRTKVGYCTQFATAMVMLARLNGIPARVAIGFLPGSALGDNRYEVLRSDAHAWPELYFPGLGWTRFEPTPGSRSGSLPPYAVSITPTNPSQSTTPTTTAPSQRPTTTAGRSSTTTADTGTTAGGPSGVGTVVTFIGWLVLVGALIGLLGSLLPFAARQEAQRRRREARTSLERVEMEWTGLQDNLSDLGVPDPPHVSPRALRRHYDSAAGLGTEAGQALKRATDTLERARYAPPQEHLDLGDDPRIIVDSVRRNASFRSRLRARLVPRAGRRWLLDHLPGQRR